MNITAKSFLRSGACFSGITLQMYQILNQKFVGAKFLEFKLKTLNKTCKLKYKQFVRHLLGFVRIGAALHILWSTISLSRTNKSANKF